MKIAKTLEEFLRLRSTYSQKRVSFVPTMGNLHQGHLSLIKQAKQHSDIVISSIFVNPAQFAPHEDFDKYPRTFETDIEKLNLNKVDLLFAPKNINELYPANFLTRVYLTPSTLANPLRNSRNSGNWLEEQPESLRRPGFFDGVATVLTKLFNIVRPNVVVFGQKDAIQCIVVKQLVRDLNFVDINVLVAEIERESNGLAMSSRNQYLSELEKKHFGPLLYGSLRETQRKFAEIRGFEKKNAKEIVKFCFAQLEERFCKAIREVKPGKSENFAIEYVSLCDNETGQVFGALLNEKHKEFKEGRSEIIQSCNDMNLSIVVRVNGTRLLDNVLLKRI